MLGYAFVRTRRRELDLIGNFTLAMRGDINSVIERLDHIDQWTSETRGNTAAIITSIDRLDMDVRR